MRYINLRLINLLTYLLTYCYMTKNAKFDFQLVVENADGKPSKGKSQCFSTAMHSVAADDYFPRPEKNSSTQGQSSRDVDETAAAGETGNCRQ